MASSPLLATPSLPPGESICGEFRRDSSYTNRRPKGSGDWLLIYTVAGVGRLVSSRGVTSVRAGELLLYSPGELQDYSTCPKTGKWHLLWVHFTPRPEWQPSLRWPVGETGLKILRIGDVEIRRELHAAMRRMVLVAKRPLPIASDLALLSLEETLLWAKLAAFENPWVTMDRRVREAINYLTDHLRDPFQYRKLSHHCGLSIYRLAHLFKKETGCTAQQFLERHRMEMAARLLQSTGFTITEVATEVGYSDPFYFSNRFRRYSKESPSHFRASRLKR